MLELVKDTLQEIADKKGITKQELKNIIKTNTEKDPHNIALLNYRYHLQPLNTIYDSHEKKYIYFKTDRQAEKWKREHKNEYITDF